MLLYLLLTLLPLLTVAQYEETTVTYNPDNDTYDFAGPEGEWSTNTDGVTYTTTTTTTTGGGVGFGGTTITVSGTETTSGGPAPVGVGIIVIIVLVAFGCILSLCCYLARKTASEAQGVPSVGAPNSTPGNTDVIFADKIKFARKGVIDVAMESEKRTAPRDGAYTVECDDSGTSSTTHMEFTPSAEHTNCWTVSGKGGDAFGSFNIEQGLVGGGGRAYWVEKDIESGRRILSTGKFVGGAFQGKWKADSGIEGTYAKFVPSAAADVPMADAVSGSKADLDVPVAEVVPVIIDEEAQREA